MIRKALIATILFSLFALPAVAQKTPTYLVGSYDALADSILALRTAELGIVKSILARHQHAADVEMRQGDWDAVAAEMALFGNEGDNAVGGVRKRLLDGGHHFNATGEEQGKFDEGFVVVTRAARKKCLDLSSALRQAKNDAERKAVYEDFVKLADKLLSDG